MFPCFAREVLFEHFALNKTLHTFQLFYNLPIRLTSVNSLDKAFYSHMYIQDTPPLNLNR